MIKEFTVVRRGYCPEEVENYINELENTIEEYKEKDGSITNAIINAQVAADNIVKNAKIQSEEIKSMALKQLTLISNSISEQRKIVKEFQSDYNNLLKKYLKDLDKQDFFAITSHINDLENYLSSLKKNKQNKKLEDK